MDLERTLAEIEEALAKATPGPWAEECIDDDPEWKVVVSKSTKEWVANPENWPGRTDTALIVALRNHAPLLIAALKAMTARRRWMRLVNENHADANAAGWEYHKAGADFDALAEGE